MYSFISPKSPITTLRKKPCQLLQIGLVNLVEPIQHGTVNINNCHQSPLNHNRHHHLTLAISVTGNVAGELIDVLDELCLLRLCRCAANAFAELDRLAGDLALEGS